VRRLGRQLAAHELQRAPQPLELVGHVLVRRGLPAALGHLGHGRVLLGDARALHGLELLPWADVHREVLGRRPPSPACVVPESLGLAARCHHEHSATKTRRITDAIIDGEALVKQAMDARLVKKPLGQ
jgi:hypothetical protein